ncbi:MAG: HNH endonuclease [Bacteroidia bacterium]|nr:HNH endonuclease [Bacteroidia bacterium]
MAKNQREQWKVIKVGIKFDRTHYAVSNLGRIASFKGSIDEKKILNGTKVNGYGALKLKIKEKDLQCYVHKLVAQHFLTKTSKAQTFVIHLDHNKLNNTSKNLRWASRADLDKHQQKSPIVRAYQEKRKLKGHKLTASKVRDIKQRIFSDTRQMRLKDIATKFGISEMQLYRIKSGKNWAHVKV